MSELFWSDSADLGGLHNRFGILLIAFWISVAQSVSAQSWEPIHGPNTGPVLAIESRGSDDLRVLAATGGTEKRGSVFMSEDGGVTWNPTRLNSLYSAEEIDLVIADSNSLFAAVSIANTGRLLVSHNSGFDWTWLRYDDFPYHSVLVEDELVLLGTGSGGYRSADGGMTWSRMNMESVSVVLDLTADSVGAIYGITDVGLLSSTDGGVSWTTPTSPGNVTLRTVTADGDSTLLIGSDSGVFIYRDGSWEQSGLTGNEVSDVSVDMQGRALAATQNGVWVRSDGTWEAATAFAGMSVAAVGQSERWLVGSGEGLHSSENLGATWELTGFSVHSIDGLLHLSDGRLLAGTVDGALLQQDGIWATTGLSDRWVRRFASSAQQIVAGTRGFGGVFRSTDGGLTWTGLGLDNAVEIFDVAIDAAGRVYASASNSVFRHSGSTSWEEINRGLPPTSYLRLSAFRGDALLAAGSSGLYLYDAADDLWRSLNIESALHDVDARSGLIYALSDRNLYVSSDGGSTWEMRQVDGGDFLGSLLVDRNGNVIVHGVNEGVWLSNDLGASWQSLAAGFPQTYFFSLGQGSDSSQVFIRSMVSDQDGVVYVGTEEWGVVKTVSSVLTNVTDREPLAFNPHVLSVYPNPISRDAKITIQLSSPAPVRIEAYDILGRVVDDVFDAHLVPGIHSVWWDSSRQAAGVYLLAVSVKGHRVSTATAVVVR